jgi:hypothetical protein
MLSKVEEVSLSRSEDKLVCLVSIFPGREETPVSLAELYFPIDAQPGRIPQQYLPCMRSGDVIAKTSVCYGTIVESKVDSFCPCNIFATRHILLCMIVSLPRLP